MCVFLLLFLWFIGLVHFQTIENGILGDGKSPLVPLHMIIVFLSCVYMTQSLDRTRFFGYLSFYCMGGGGSRKGEEGPNRKQNQMDIFWKNLLLSSFLSITINPDVTVMSVTPFMYHFCQSCKIRPEPFLFLTLFSTSVYGVRSLGSASTYAMTEALQLSQWNYFRWMFFPHFIVLVGGTYCVKNVFEEELMGRKQHMNEEEMCLVEEETKEGGQKRESILKRPEMLNERVGFSFAVILAATTCVMTFGESLIPVWITAMLGAMSIFIGHCIIDFINRTNRGQSHLRSTCSGAPELLPDELGLFPSLASLQLDWAPFVFSCFIIIECIREQNCITHIVSFLRNTGELDEDDEIGCGRIFFLVTLYSFLAIFGTVLLNKNPATIFFCRLLLDSNFTTTNRERWAMSLGVMYGLNIGIYFASVGSMTVLAWLDILNRKGIYLQKKEFSLYGLKCIGIPAVLGIFCLSVEAMCWPPPDIPVSSPPIIRPWSGWQRSVTMKTSGLR